ncbi:unnamed protein product [Discula destructiva]
MAQLPAGAEGAAAGVLVWSHLCLSANVLLLWLLWTGNERRSYIFIVACVTLLATSTSIVQQIYDIVHYEDILYARLAWIQSRTDNALVVTTDGTAPGVDLVMWSIRWGCYVAESGIACFWAFTLCQSVYGWRDDERYGRALQGISELGKPFSILAAIFTMAILQVEALQKSYVGWNFVLNFCYCLFCAGGLFSFFLIFIEYFQTRRLFRRMNSQQRHEWERQPSPTESRDHLSSSASSVHIIGRVPTKGGEHFGALAQRQGGIYDKYLIVRTFLPCLALSLFEVYNILLNSKHPAEIRALAQTTMTTTTTTTGPGPGPGPGPGSDLSAASAQRYCGNFVPGCLASLILALAFGTTRCNRDRLYHLVVPERWQSAARRDRYHKARRDRYQAMDSDNGILSRQKRLSMEKRLRIEVTYEFEIRTESVEVESPTVAGAPPPGGLRRADSTAALLVKPCATLSREKQ